MLATSAAVFSVLLVITGIAKIVRPSEVQRALVALGLPRLAGVGVVIGSIEVVVGICALVSLIGLVVQAVIYFAFAVWVIVALRSGVPLATCGCFGRDDTPPSWAHVILNTVGTGVSLGAVGGVAFQVTASLPGVVQVTVIGVAVFLSYVVLTDAAALVGLRAAK